MPNARVVLPILLLLAGSLSTANEPRVASDGHVTVITYSADDDADLPRLFAAVRQARRDLRRDWGWRLPGGVTIVVHPDLGSYSAATGMPWYVAGTADRAEQRIDLQRLRVLRERHSLEPTLRHELFHLAQPDNWPRWRAEGAAMLFAGETPQAAPFADISAAQLDDLLAAAPDREALARAAATAYDRVLCQQQGRCP
ncbi:MAG: hypothetical protein U5L04_09175 [Trueperaceae bacterium]|nr:hypothetical protein [Trueperaceae bacterium]